MNKNLVIIFFAVTAIILLGGFIFVILPSLQNPSPGDTSVVANNRTCGQTCSGIIGLCTGGTSCTYVSRPECSLEGTAQEAEAYCVPVGSRNGGKGSIRDSWYTNSNQEFERRACSDGLYGNGNNFVYHATKPSRRWTEQDVITYLCNPRPQNICGDGILDSGEICDESASSNGCTNGGTCSSCGICVAPEPLAQCEDGLDNDGDGRIDCQAGNEDPGCFPNGNGGGGSCNPDHGSEVDIVAVSSTCGNGVLDAGEQCDLGGANLNTGSTCSKSCRLNDKCNDGLDNDLDGFIDCQVGNSDPGCFPDGNGGGGKCRKSGRTEFDGVLPETGLFDEDSRFLLVGLLLFLGAIVLNRVESVGLGVLKIGEFTQDKLQTTRNKLDKSILERNAQIYEDKVKERASDKA